MPDLEERAFENLVDGLSVRREHPDDRAFLECLYASTREHEMCLLDWSREAKKAFIRQQFEAQHAHYRQHYSDAEFWIVEVGGRPVGRIYVQGRDDEIRLMDIALVPERKGKGIGTALMRRVLDIASEEGIPVRLHVEPDNRAVNLYRRLGFVKLEDRGVYQFMEWCG